MSLNSFEKMNQQSKAKYEEVLTEDKKENATTVPANEESKIMIPQRKVVTKETKKAVSFSVTDSQLEKFEKEATERGFKNRSEFLGFIIDNL